MDNLKKYILKNLPFLNNGFVGVFLDNISGKLISWNGEDIGIDDRRGKYFYIREVGDEALRVESYQAPKTLKSTQNYKLVLFAERLNIQDVKACLINTLSFYEDLTINSVSTNIGDIVKNEYPLKKSAEILDVMKKINFGTLVSIDFQISKDVFINNCECKICEEC